MKWIYINDSEERPAGEYFVLVLLGDQRTWTVARWDFEVQQWYRGPSPTDVRRRIAAGIPTEYSVVVPHVSAWLYVRDEDGNVLQPTIATVG